MKVDWVVGSDPHSETMVFLLRLNFKGSIIGKGLTFS